MSDLTFFRESWSHLERTDVSYALNYILTYQGVFYGTLNVFVDRFQIGILLINELFCYTIDIRSIINSYNELIDNPSSTNYISNFNILY